MEIGPASQLLKGFDGNQMIVVVMGVVGAGKTTIGRLLAGQLHWEFADADDFHPQANVDKIHHGIPLTDDDRKPWLLHLRQQIEKWISQNQNAVLACSALKARYRDELRVDSNVKFVYLQGSASLIAERLRARHGHFADERILRSQFADLEVPEDAITASIAPSPDNIVADIRRKLDLL